MFSPERFRTLVFFSTQYCIVVPFHIILLYYKSTTMYGRYTICPEFACMQAHLNKAKPALHKSDFGYIFIPYPGQQYSRWPLQGTRTVGQRSKIDRQAWMIGKGGRKEGGIEGSQRQKCANHCHQDIQRLLLDTIPEQQDTWVPFTLVSNRKGWKRVSLILY